MGLPVRVVSHPDSDFKSARNEHLWLLVGGADYCDGATAFYLGADHDISCDDLAGRQLDEVVQRAAAAGLDIDRGEVEEALAEYRRARAT